MQSDKKHNEKIVMVGLHFRASKNATIPETLRSLVCDDAQAWCPRHIFYSAHSMTISSYSLQRSNQYTVVCC